jgi:lysophospholipase L1-like esterase
MGVAVKINADGFRDADYAIARNKKKRFILLGDSLTLGWGVEQDQTFATILERTLNPPTEVINQGTGNYNTEQEVYLFLDKGLKYKPDKVVVFYFINDAEPTPPQSDWRLLAYSELVTLYWARTQGMLNRLTGALQYEKYYKALYKNGQPGWVNAQRAFLRLKQVCIEHSIALQVVLLPDLHNLVDYPFLEEHAKVSNFLSTNGIQHLDLAPTLRDIEHPKSLWVAPDDAHPNATAHRLIAKHSLDFIGQ